MIPKRNKSLDVINEIEDKIIEIKNFLYLVSIDLMVQYKLQQKMLIKNMKNMYKNFDKILLIKNKLLCNYKQI